MEKNINNQEGYFILMTAFFVLIIMLSMAISMSFLIGTRQKSTAETIKSTQSYYAAEAGIEDALLRLKKTPGISSLNYNLIVNNATTAVNIPSTIGISKTITSQATNNGMARKVQTVASIDNSMATSFYYGAQVGAGGLHMDNGSRVMGNVFSDGNISGSGTIDNNVVVSGNGHSINDVTVKGNALVYSCLSEATINGNLTWVTGGSHACTVGGTISEQSAEISEQPLPIPQSQIDEWKSEAATVKVTSGNVTINSNQTLGPVKITGSLTINGGVTLTITGTVYVVGNVTFQNNANIKLDSSYGSAGGVIISDGKITLHNNDVFSGSGQAGSYIMVLSTNTADLAIDVQNNAQGAVLYTTAGGITIHNNVSVTEATGYKVVLQNNAKVQYSSGIVNIYFTSGTGGGWKISGWQEY